MSTSPVWHVLRTLAGRERVVAEALGGGYVPMVRRWRPRLLRRGRKDGEGVTPLLATYVFLAAPVHAWRDVLGHPMVRGVLTVDGSPACVHDHELAELRRAAGRRPVEAGDLVRVKHGAWAGLDLVATAVDEKRQVIVADVALLGRTVGVSVSVAAL